MVMQAQRLLKFCILGVSLSLYQTSTYSFNNILKYLCEPNTALDARHPEEQQSDKSFCPQSWVAICAMEKDKAEKGIRKSQDRVWGVI